MATTDGTDLNCPLCSYNLRGLTEPRCPECGYAFAWADLLDAKRDRHPWLFEHASRQPPRPWRTARALVSTYVRTALPRRFWRTVTPTNPVHIARLLAYWVVTSLLLLSVFAIDPIELTLGLARENAAMRANFTPTPGQSGYVTAPAFPMSSAYVFNPQLYALCSRTGRTLTSISISQFDALIPRPFSVGFALQTWKAYADRSTGCTGQASAIVALWPWMSLVALLLFQASMRRAKVGWRHLVRMVIYSCDFGLLVTVGAVVLYTVPIGSNGVIANAIPVWPVSWECKPVVFAIVACVILATCRLSVGCSRYLRFDRPVLAVLASQAIVLLAVSVVISRSLRLF